MSGFIPLSVPNFGEKEAAYAAEAITSGWVSTSGAKVSEFEEALAAYVGMPRAVAANSGTSSLHLAAMAAGIRRGDEVIVPTLTFIAAVNPLTRYVGAEPIFIGCNDTLCIDPDAVEDFCANHCTLKEDGLYNNKTGARVRALGVVHVFGNMADMPRLAAIAKRYHLILIEDAAHAIGTKYKGQPVGSLADMTCFSFHPVKTVTGGEGGAITTNDEKLYRHLMRLRTHGITRDPAEMVHPTDALWYNEQVELGFNYRMTDFQAALLLSQLKKLPAFEQRRKEIRKRYNEAFGKMPELILQKEIPESDTTWHLYVLHLNLENLNCDRRQFFDALYAENTCPQVHYLPVYWHSYYEKLGYQKGLCPNAEKYYNEVMSIPLYYGLTDDDVEDVIHAVKKVVAYYTKLK